MNQILEARGLTKRFGRTQGLDGLDLVAARGQVTGILGPNGAGKTTLIRMVGTLLRPDMGTLTVAGIDAVRHPAQVRRAIGLAGQSAAVEGAMTGRENLEFVGRLFGHDRRQAAASAEVVLDRMSMTDDADRLVRTYSGGMRRKLDLGASLVGAPELLLLDEPTAGLDPHSRNELWDIIRALVAAGTDVLLTTQYLEEADQLADHIAIIDHGRVIAEGTPHELKSRGGFDVVEVHVPDAADLQPAVGVLTPFGAGAPRVDVPTGSVAIPVQHGSVRVLDVTRALDLNGVNVTDVSLRRASLDEAFLALTGKRADSHPDTNTEGDAFAATGGSRRRRRPALTGDRS